MFVVSYPYFLYYAGIPHCLNVAEVILTPLDAPGRGRKEGG